MSGGSCTGAKNDGICSTGIAALAAGRNSVLIDNDPKYCQQALERIQKEVAGAAFV